MTSSNGNIFRVTGPLWGAVTSGFPSQRPATQSFDVDLRPNKWLNKQSRRRWFETQSQSFWRHCNDNFEKFVNELHMVNLNLKGK